MRALFRGLPQRKFTGAVFDNTPASHFRLLEKYKSIRFVDEGEVYVISDTNLVYKRGTGFSVVTNTLDPDEDDVDQRELACDDQ